MEFCMGLKEISIYCRKCIIRVVIVAFSAQPPGVNKLCVCIQSRRRSILDLLLSRVNSLV